MEAASDILIRSGTTKGQPSMFDIEPFVTDIIAAGDETEPRLAVKDVLTRAMRDSLRVAEVLPAMRAGIVPLYASDRLSVLHVVWAPGMRFRPHNHLMWAAIAMYGGQEDNTFFRRTQHGLAESGGRSLREGDVALLGDDTIHAVSNPRRTHAGAIHVYGGNITAQPGRSEWDEDTDAEIPYDFDRTRRYFEAANGGVAVGAG
jgi:predicted metal-dependent enzyme (double-stranded beta helix superfamily)